MTYQPMKPGTRIEISAPDGFGGLKVQTAKVLRWTKQQGPRDGLPAGYEHVRYDTGNTSLMVFCDTPHVRVISNHA